MLTTREMHAVAAARFRLMAAGQIVAALADQVAPGRLRPPPSGPRRRHLPKEALSGSRRHARGSAVRGLACAYPPKKMQNDIADSDQQTLFN